MKKHVIDLSKLLGALVVIFGVVSTIATATGYAIVFEKDFIPHVLAQASRNCVQDIATLNNLLVMKYSLEQQGQPVPPSILLQISQLTEAVKVCSQA